jgi:hypothetical protein
LGSGALERLEATESLDATADALWEVLPDWVVTGWGRELLGSTGFGHLLPRLLTRLALGFWVSASLLDLLRGRRHASTFRRFVGFGLLALLPAAAAGLSAWSQIGRRDRRVGLAHKRMNSAPR